MLAETTISIERKLQMYAARERILDRINPEINKAIDLHKFLQATVTELGKMMEVDRCDMMVVRKDAELKIDFEYRTSQHILSSLGLSIPLELQRLSRTLNLTSPIAINDTQTSSRDPIFRQLAESLQTRSLLVVPITLSSTELLGFLGFHQCERVRNWVKDEIEFVESIARLIAVGYQYTRIYQEKEKEAEINKVLLEIANDINIQRDLAAITSHTVKQSLAILKADFGCLAMLDSNKHIYFDAVSQVGASGQVSSNSLSPLPLSEYPFLRRTFSDKRTLVLESTDTSELSRFYLEKLFKGQAALVAPVLIKEKVLGILVLVWSETRRRFTDFEVKLAEGIASQIAIAMEREQLSAEVLQLRRELKGRQASNVMVGSSDKIRQLIEKALNVAETSSTVLLEGETGTGKEVLATFIQQNSLRKDGPFVKVNCGAIAESLMESELFGHEKGAFTDARNRRIGLFEEANFGTLFLDEVGEMSPAAQVKLLRVLEDNIFTRVGSNETIKVDVRIIAATNVDLKEAIERGRFRADLYYRLNVYPIKLPGLKERKEDIPLLAMHFLDLHSKNTGKSFSGISDSALQLLKAYDWPGNVRELDRIIQRAAIPAKSRILTVEDFLSIEIFQDLAPQVNVPEKVKLEIELGTPLEMVERQLIEQTLTFTQGDKSRAASLLQIGRKTLYRKLEQYQQEK
ncbi:MAG: sigma 54-interacting transcriptional regulator [Acidobacteria bacterium]|nr:sigma 54-interacting transcriptional regulator [Acidobacteriota bacterium]